MEDSIEKTLELKAPVARVWRALTDHEEFGAWFRVRIDGPFEVGELSTGQNIYPGCDHMAWKVMVKRMEPEQLLAFTWCPLADTADYDFELEPKTLVEFKLEPTADGARLHIRESGFSALPEDSPRLDVLRRNTGGWAIQCQNISTHVEDGGDQ